MTVLPQQVKVRGKEWRAHHAQFRDLADRTGEWAGIPLDVDGFSVQIEDRHPHRAAFERILSKPTSDGFVCSTSDIDDTVHIRNVFFSYRRHAWVWLYQRGDGPVEMLLDRADRTAGRRLTFALGTIGVSQAWDLDAEMRARDKLRSLVAPHIYAMYELTGSLLETSPRSRVHYMLRRCRPTVAMVPTVRGEGEADSSMKILAVLCMHPLGYYRDTWGGSMVPTDDVIAHLLMIRADEHGFWRRANQHHSQSAEAGL